MRNGLVLVALPVTCLLAGCSVAREQVRLEYDPAKVVPNAARASIEAEIGAPDHVTVTRNGLVEATYTSARVSRETKQILISQHELLDLFLVGGGEVLDPLAISDNEEKVFLIEYGSDQRAISVRMRCKKGWPSYYRAVPPQGFSTTCTPLIKG